MYIKTIWQNDVTEVDADHMNHIEDGIEEVDQRVDNTNEFIIKKIVELLEVGSAPITCVEGDKYFNTTTNKIYTATATNTWGTTGEDAQKNAIYYVINTKKTYAYNGTTLINIGDVGGINVVNEESQSTTDTYSCDYVNTQLNDAKKDQVYSTTEQQIGNWVDGKPLYRRAFNFTNLSNVPQISNVIDNVVRLNIMIKDASSNNWRTIPWCYDATDPNFMGGAFINSGGYIGWQIGSGLSNFSKGTVIVEYTKTTD